MKERAKVMNDLNEMIKQNGADPKAGTHIECPGDRHARLFYLSVRSFPAVWQGRDGPIPYGTPGRCRPICWGGGAEEFFLFHEGPDTVFLGGIFVGPRLHERVFVPAWGRTLHDMLALDPEPVPCDSDPITNYQLPSAEDLVQLAHVFGNRPTNTHPPSC